MLILAHQWTDNTHNVRNLVKGLKRKVIVVETNSQNEREDSDEEDTVEYNKTERICESLHDYTQTRKIPIIDGKQRVYRNI